MTDEKTTVFQCSHMGVSTTTGVRIHRHKDGTFEARVGVAIMGAMNMDEAGFAACDHDPFHERFHDNYASGAGPTEGEALRAMEADMHSISETLWL